MTAEFILRRTSQVNKKYLPAKVDHVVFCRLTNMQKDLYRSICERFRNRVPNDTENAPLALMTHLKKLCNTPALIFDNYCEKFQYGPQFNPKVFQPEFSGKLQFVVTLLRNVRAAGKDKFVIVSNYTQTLEVLGAMCEAEGWKYFQLDGSTKVVKRQELVDVFNDEKSEEFIFLLSSKAGGCGLNLVGANHLIMLDPDWNPANDAQAMARVWRPGQQKRVYLYRTLCTGTVEEKIFQRQVAKLALADQVVNSNADAEPEFDDKELKDLFTFRDDTLCETHDLLNCRCAGMDNFKKIPLHKRQAVSVDALRGWEHVPRLELVKAHQFMDKCDPHVSFVFLKEADPAKEAEEEEKAGKALDVKEVALQFEIEEDADAAAYEGGSSTRRSRVAAEDLADAIEDAMEVDGEDDGGDLEGFVVGDDSEEEEKPKTPKKNNSAPSSTKKRKREVIADDSEGEDGWMDGENASEDDDYDG
jgi:DNA repair and recombination protein RAD54 and RAD54-like protein